MCLLTYVPAGKQPDRACLLNGTVWNDDGHGWAIVVPKTNTRPASIIRHRGLNALQVIDEFMTTREHHPDGPAMFHSRMATHGETSKTNCHPFYAGDIHTVVGHNGVFPTSVHPGKHDPRSDTAIFAARMIAKDHFGPLDNRSTRRRMSKWMGTSNKVLILTVDPRRASHHYLINERYGQWHGGIWYSNSGYQTPTYSYGYGYGHQGDESDRYVAWWQDMKEGSQGLADELSERYKGRWVDCEVCFSKYTVNPETAVCVYCKSCQDCLDDVLDCQCFIGADSHGLTIIGPSTTAIGREVLPYQGDKIES